MTDTQGSVNPIVSGARARDVLKRTMPLAILEEHVSCDELTVVIDRSELVAVVKLLRDHHEALYTLPVLVTAVDYPDREPDLPRFDVVYVLRSLSFNDSVQIIVRVTEKDPHVPTLEDVYAGMDWHERETFDLFGIVFDGHHDLKRILLPNDWEGYPLRKDYISFGEPVAFTHNIDWASQEAQRPDTMPGEMK